jgi:hypothetical protein
MNDDPKSDEAKKLIDTFAVRLLALNDGRKIPADWRRYLNTALAPKAGKAGAKRNLGKIKQVAIALLRTRHKIHLPRTKDHNPAVLKDRIAAQAGVSRKTVERIMESKREYLTKGLEPPPGMSPIIVEAIAEVIGESIDARQKLEEDAKQKMIEAIWRDGIFPPK